MRRLRVAVVFDQKINGGGGFQQALNAALQCKNISNKSIEIKFISTLKENIETLRNNGIEADLISLSLSRKIFVHIRRVLNKILPKGILKAFKSHSYFENILKSKNIDLVYFLAPSSWALDLNELNYIITVWDLCHRDHPEFPEVRWSYQFEKREELYGSLLSKATAVLTDSSHGKSNVIKRYGLDDDKVFVVPFEASVATKSVENKLFKSSVDISIKYGLKDPYVFYPAQFWPHKNHIYLLDGLRILEEEYSLRIGAIFTGADCGNLFHVKSYASVLNLQDRIIFAGYVKDDELNDLYDQAIALVMPTYFGPTNIPPLEAFQIGVPVLYPDLDGMREQVSDAALLIDLDDPSTMAMHIKELVTDECLRSRLISLGKQRLDDINAIDRVGILEEIFQKFYRKRMTWGE